MFVGTSELPNILVRNIKEVNSNRGPTFNRSPDEVHRDGRSRSSVVVSETGVVGRPLVLRLCLRVRINFDSQNNEED